MILIASAIPETRNHFSECLEPMGLVVTVSDYFTAFTAIMKLRPKLLFIDVALADFEGAAHIAAMCHRSPQTKIIAFGSQISAQSQAELFLAGAHGYCSRSLKQAQLQRLVNAVNSDEIWISRVQTAYLLRCLKQRLPDVPASLEKNPLSLTTLTRREKEIAILVGNGKNNRQISQALQISETTVKSHLSTVFRKLGINDRLSLALQVTTFIQAARPAQIPAHHGMNEILQSAQS
ncbi:MAG: DNA-binding response regulator [Burkholderiaceae bacterium]